MTLPPPVLPGKTYMITRRCNERQFLLRPSEDVNQIVAYALAVAQQKHGVLVHTFGFMSNHLHLEATDVRGVFPDFCREFHTTIARCMNRLLQRDGAFFEAKQTHRLELNTAEEFVRYAAYVISNPVRAGLVDSPEKWPGLVSPRLDQKWEVKRPAVYFDNDGAAPSTATLELTAPPLMADYSRDQIQEMVNDAVNEQIVAKKADMRAKGQKFKGADSVLNTEPTTRATSPEPVTWIPRFAEKNKTLRVKLIKKAQQWVRGYRVALKSWTAGVRNIEFPPGTWQMHRQFGVSRAIPQEFS